MNRAVQQGLTIIELMIIVTIVGILASVAIPKYQDYKVTEKVRDAVNLANPALTALAVACSTGKLYGANNESLGLSPAETYSGDSTRSIAAAGVSPTEGGGDDYPEVHCRPDRRWTADRLHQHL